MKQLLFEGFGALADEPTPGFVEQHVSLWRAIHPRYSSRIAGHWVQTLASYTVSSDAVHLHHGGNPVWSQLFADGLLGEDRQSIERYLRSTEPRINYIAIVLESSSDGVRYTVMSVDQQYGDITYIFSHSTY